MKIEHARNIARTRKSQGLNKTDFASQLGVSRNTLDRIEAFSKSSPDTRYPYIPSLSTALKVADYLERNPEDLLTRRDLDMSCRTKYGATPVQRVSWSPATLQLVSSSPA